MCGFLVPASGAMKLALIFTDVFPRLRSGVVTRVCH